MKQLIHISASNVHGLGASQIVESLLPALAAVGSARLGTVFVPETGPLADMSTNLGLVTVKVVRHVPKAMSRVTECLFSRHYYPINGNILVLGDLPLAIAGKQVVLVHRTHMVSGADTGSISGNAKVAVSRWLFHRNAKHIHRAIVQSDVIGNKLRDNFPELRKRICVLPQPAPQWLAAVAPVERSGTKWDGSRELRLLYPASAYPHKNHDLLHRYARDFGGRREAHILLTLDAVDSDWSDMLKPIGLQGPDGMRDQYRLADALLFPSLDESYGLPLVEAMTIGLPILVANRPYAHSLCGDTAIYFDPADIASLDGAIGLLRQRLITGWVPDYSARLSLIPHSWNEVAQRMFALFDSD